MMYILIRIGINDSRSVELASKTKNKIIVYLKEKGYYYSEKLKRYINDRTIGIEGGNGVDYCIIETNELT